MSIRIKEALVVVGLIAFILFINRRETYVDASMADIASSISDTAEVSELESFGAVKLKKDYHILSSEYEELLYLGYESFMDSNKVIVVKLSDEASGSAMLKTFTDERDASMEVFKSYAPDQYELLGQAVLEQKGQYVIYIVSEDSKAIYKKILSCITK